MTREEAVKVADIIRTADGCCIHCASDLADQLTAAGLGWEFTIVNVVEDGFEVFRVIPVEAVKSASPSFGKSD
jgi:hypothetical protein